MTAPVMPTAPAARAPSTGATASAESAAPFASALDGALAEGRATVGDRTAGDGEQPDPESPGGTVVPLDAVLDVSVALAAPLWALALGAPVTGQPEVDGGTGPDSVLAGQAAGALPVAGAPAVAQAVPGVAPAPGAGLPAGLDVVAGHGTAPGNVPTGAPGGPVQAAPSDPAVAGAVAGAVTTARTPATPVPDAPTGTAAPAVGTVPGVATAPAGGAGAGTGGTGQDAGGAAADGEPAAPFPITLPGATPTPVAAATAAAVGATGDAASLPVAGQVARHVAVLRGAPDGSHTMTLVLTPETLGPVEVSVTVSKGAVDLVLRGAHEQGRAALLDALPDLRRDLESAGLTTSRLEVARESGGSWLDRHAAGQQAQQGFGERPGQQGPADGRSRPWLRTADSGETRTVPTTGSASSGVDVRV